jgi:hypothetical protein
MYQRTPRGIVTARVQKTRKAPHSTIQATVSGRLLNNEAPFVEDADKRGLRTQIFDLRK